MARSRKPEPKPNVWQRAASWMRSHWQDLLIIGVLALITGVVTGTNLGSYPMRFEDEGTYVAQAWAVQKQGELAHYTYWYDHPPAAWIQLAIYTTITFAFERQESAIEAGREFMLLMHVLSVIILYAIARRLAMGKVVAVVVSLLFALSPLSVEFSRLVLLDNIALPWMLGAFLLALSPKRHLWTIAASAVFMAVAVLSKETFLIFLPALIYMIYQHSDVRNRRFVFLLFGVIFTLLVASYALLAALKNELFPGEGHVSLIGTVLWQLFGREGSGSILDAGSDARGLLTFWLDIDTWLLGLGVILTPLAFIRRQFRPIALALLIGLVMMLRGGYLPYPYIIALLPLASLVIGAVLTTFLVEPIQRGKGISARIAEVLAVVVALGGLYFVAPAWQAGISEAMTRNADESSKQAVAWVLENVPRDQRMVVESALWVDLQTKGFDQPDPVWLYKTETDPEVQAEIDGWQGIDYIVLNGPTLDESSRGAFPTVFEAKDNAEVVAEFGENELKVIVMKVNNGR